MKFDQLRQCESPALIEAHCFMPGSALWIRVHHGRLESGAPLRQGYEPQVAYKAESELWNRIGAKPFSKHARPDESRRIFDQQEATAVLRCPLAVGRLHHG